MSNIPTATIKSYLNTWHTCKERRYNTRTPEGVHSKAQADFAFHMARLRLLRAAKASPVLIQMAGEDMGEALHLIKYYRFRSPQVLGKGCEVQTELPLYINELDV